MVVAEVDVEVLVDEVVEVLIVLLVGGAMVVVVEVVVVGTIVVVDDVVLVDVDTRVLVPAGDSVVREGELLGASHPVATRTRVMIGSDTSFVNSSATRGSRCHSRSLPTPEFEPVVPLRRQTHGDRRIASLDRTSITHGGRRIYVTRNWNHAAATWNTFGLCLLDSVYLC